MAVAPLPMSYNAHPGSTSPGPLPLTPSVLRPVPQQFLDNSSGSSSSDMDSAASYPNAFHPIDMSPAPPSPQLQISALAQFFAELTVWLWHGDSSHPAQDGSLFPHCRPSQKQLVPTDRFLRFCADCLATTQVSRSVVLLALLYIAKLKTQNSISGQSGSEFRLAVVSLMLANKILDDHTYTAKTWAEVSSLELKPLLAGEVEFLLGLDFKVHVTEREFKAWTKVVEQHVATRKSCLASSTSSSFSSSSRKRIRPSPPQLSSTPLFGLGFGDLETPSHDIIPASDPQRERELRRTRRERNRLEHQQSQYPPPSFSFPQPISSPPAPPPTSHFPSHSVFPSPSQSLPAGPTAAVRSSLHTRSSSENYQLSYNRKRSAPEGGFAGDDEEDGAPKRRLGAPWIAKSYSAGSAPAYHNTHLSPSFPIHPGHQLPLQYSSNASSPVFDRFSTTTTPVTSTAPWSSSPLDPRHSLGDFQNLADRFSPAHTPVFSSRPDMLSYYSLSALENRNQRRPRQTSINEPVAVGHGQAWQNAAQYTIEAPHYPSDFQPTTWSTPRPMLVDHSVPPYY